MVRLVSTTAESMSTGGEANVGHDLYIEPENVRLQHRDPAMLNLAMLVGINRAT